MLPHDRPLTEAERYPLLSERGRRLLRWMHEHEHAPKYNHQCGDRLDAMRVANVRAFEEKLFSATPAWRWGERPDWVEAFRRDVEGEAPIYRERLRPGMKWSEMPTFSRADLSRGAWHFVPDREPLEDVIQTRTSGRTGHPLLFPFHPLSCAKYLPLMRRALSTVGVTLDGGPERVSIVLACAQKKTLTCATLATYLDEAGFVKLNLHPESHDWREPEDVGRYLAACAPEIYTGDPLSFATLAETTHGSKPKALLSTAMAMTPSFRTQIEAKMGCPVLDVYSLAEASPVAVRRGEFWELLAHDIFVEILDEDGRLCPPGVRGEVTLTGGRNPYLPLLRYRTGDWASMDFSGPSPRLAGLEGRSPVYFRDAAGKLVNNIDVTHALRDLDTAQFTLHQRADGALELRRRGGWAGEREIRAALTNVFGAEMDLHIGELPDDEGEAAGGKVIQYTSDLPGFG